MFDASALKIVQIVCMLTLACMSWSSFAATYTVSGMVTDIVAVQEADATVEGYKSFYDITIDPSAGSDVVLRTNEARAAQLLATARDKRVVATVHYKDSTITAGKYEIDFIDIVTGLSARDKVTQLKYIHSNCNEASEAAKEWSEDLNACTNDVIPHGLLAGKMIAWIQIGAPGIGNPPTPHLVTEEEVQLAVESSVDRDCDVSVDAQAGSELCIGGSRVNRIQKVTTNGCGTP